jgi:hypothetical protein
MSIAMLLVYLGLIVLVGLWLYYSVISPETPQTRQMVRFRTYILPLGILGIFIANVAWTFYSDNLSYETGIKKSNMLTGKYFTSEEGGRRRRR